MDIITTRLLEHEKLVHKVLGSKKLLKSIANAGAIWKIAIN